ncbi:radical SAM protein [Sulfurimonas sp.]
MRKKSKYSKYKIFNYKEKILSLPSSNKEIMPPIHIRIKPTNICLHNCWYCSYRLDEIQLGKDMIEKDYIPKDKMMEIIDDCIDMGVKAITFSGGGDPFYYKYLLESVEKLSSSPIQFAALTNGVNLKGKIAELFAHNAQWIRISMDGWDAQSYSEYRGVKESEFDKVISNMKNFKKLNGKCALGVSFIIDNKNYTHIYEFVKMIKNTGADSIKIAPCVVSNSGKDSNIYHQPFFDIANKEVKRAKKDFEDESFEVFDSYHLLEDKFEKDYDWCPYLQVLSIIGADMNVYSCQDKAYNLDEGLVGSIKDIGFKDFWMNGKNKFYNINPSKVCNHHCISNESNKTLIEYINIDKEHIGFV